MFHDPCAFISCQGHHIKVTIFDNDQYKNRHQDKDKKSILTLTLRKLRKKNEDRDARD